MSLGHDQGRCKAGHGSFSCGPLRAAFYADFWSRVKYSIRHWKEHVFANCLGDERHNDTKRFWCRPKSGGRNRVSTYRRFLSPVFWLGSLSLEENVRLREARVRLAQERIRTRERAFFIERNERKLAQPDLTASIKVAKRMVYHRINQEPANWQKNSHTLILEIGNMGREKAKNCHANLTIIGVTEELEQIPWRVIQVAGGHGSAWIQVDKIDILRGFGASLWICYSFEEATKAFVETARPEIQDSFAPYALKFGQTYEAEVRVLGEALDLKVWRFTFCCNAWQDFEYTEPQLIFVEGNS